MSQQGTAIGPKTGGYGAGPKLLEPIPAGSGQVTGAAIILAVTRARSSSPSSLTPASQPPPLDLKQLTTTHNAAARRERRGWCGYQDGLWSTDLEDHQLFLMGRLLSYEQPRFEALISSLKSILNPVKGLEMRQLAEGRLLILFNHVINWWSFEKRHIHNYCELRFEEGYTDLGEAISYRAWLHVLPVNWSAHTIGKSSDPPKYRWRQPDTPRGPEVFSMFGDKGFHYRAPSIAPSASPVSSVLATILPRNDIVPLVPTIPDGGKRRCLMLLFRKEISLVVHSFSGSHIDAGVFDEKGLGFVPKILMKFFVNPRKLALLAPGVKSKSSDPAFLIVSLLIWAIWAISWRTKFPNTNVEAVAARGSDHNPLLINLEADKGPRHRQRQKIFRFESMWTQSEECEDIVKDTWCGEVEGDAGSRILWCTRRVQEELIRWDRERFGHVRRHVRELEAKLEAYAKDPTSASDNSKRRALRGKLDEFLTRKEILWK
ncbi:UNVERIFIED_CONTAM: hypothetical protein Scaly_3048700 [Sesamum calycinum]|uniref:Uncharacterized protein n=1 Tax=Sesamum calycinum TaxID=2727403 RepID=A0AAW2K307_9LAMI